MTKIYHIFNTLRRKDKYSLNIHLLMNLDEDLKLFAHVRQKTEFHNNFKEMTKVSANFVEFKIIQEIH